MTTRYAAMAGSFYPKVAKDLSSTVSSLLDQAPASICYPKASTCSPKAIIAPHAGYIYSGPIAATAYKTLTKSAAQITKVVVLGPSHHVAFKGIAAPDSECFETPLGSIDIDGSAMSKALALPYVSVRPDAHLLEHSIEVQLPFLQTVLTDFAICPLVVGDANVDEVADLLECLWGSNETLIVISSDLSHYLPYDSAQILDTATSQAIEALNPNLSGDQACGCRAVNGLLKAAQRHHLSAKILDLRNSGDTAGDKARVVGYGAYALQ